MFELFVIKFGVQFFAGVQLVFDQQTKNESYEFTRCKRECSLVLMFGNLSIFFRIEFFVLRNMTSYAVGSFSEIITKIFVILFGSYDTAAMARANLAAIKTAGFTAEIEQ